MRLHTVWFSYTVLLTGIYPYMDALLYLKSRMQTAVSLLLLSSVLIVQDVRAQDPTVYNFPIGYTQCYSCQAGSYIESEGSGQCKACGPGFYQDVNGSTFCKACPEGEWKVPNTAVMFARVCNNLLRKFQVPTTPTLARPPMPSAPSAFLARTRRSPISRAQPRA